MAIALCQQKYNIQALGIIPAVETPCTLTNPHSQSLDRVGDTGHMININTVLLHDHTQYKIFSAWFLDIRILTCL